MNPVVLGAIGVAALLLLFHRSTAPAAAAGDTSAGAGAGSSDGGAGGIVGLPPGAAPGSPTTGAGSSSAFAPSDSGSAPSQDSIVSTYTAEPTGSGPYATGSTGTSYGGSAVAGTTGPGGYVQPFDANQLLLNAQAREAPVAAAPVTFGGTRGVE